MKSLWRRLFRRKKSDVLGQQATNSTVESTEGYSRFFPKHPKYLYRYCSADRAIQILRDKYLFLCPLDRLNDMFDASVGSAIKFSPDVAHELEVRRIMAFGGFSRRVAEEFVREQSTPKEQRDNFKHFTDELRKMNSRMRKHSGVVCFSATFNDQRMWGTYGDNHSGVCIQFWDDEGKSVVHKHVQPVIYTNEPRGDILIGRMDERGALSPATLGGLFYLTKTPHWVGENEWRIVMLADKHQSDQDRRFRFSASNIRRIYLGPRILPEKREEIWDIARKHTADWALFDVRADPDTGTSSFHGLEQIKNIDDFEFHARYALPDE